LPGLDVTSIAGQCSAKIVGGVELEDPAVSAGVDMLAAAIVAV
jgi:hypothetical protein